MTAYYILIGIPVLLQLFLTLKNSTGQLLKVKKNNASRAVIITFFVIFFLLLIFRRQDIGIDLSNYKNMFKRVYYLSFSELLKLKTELGYLILNKVVSKIYNNFQFFMGVVAFITVLPLGILYAKESENALLSIAVFLNLTVFNMLFSGLRQSIAIALAVPIYYFTKNKKLFWFLFFAAIAFFFHKSSLVMLIIYPLYHANIRKNKLWVIFPVMFVGFIFRARIFSFLLKYIGEEYNERYGMVSNTGAYNVLVLFVLFLVYSFVMVNDNNADKDFIGLRNFMLAATCIQFFASLNSVAMRVNYYFIVFIPILISKVYNRCEGNKKNIALIGNTVMISFFFLYFFYSAYTGKDILQIFPYKAFWQKEVINYL